MSDIVVAVVVVFFAIFYGVLIFIKGEKGERLAGMMSGVLVPAALMIGIGIFALCAIGGLIYSAIEP